MLSSDLRPSTAAPPRANSLKVAEKPLSGWRCAYLDINGNGAIIDHRRDWLLIVYALLSITEIFAVVTVCLGHAVSRTQRLVLDQSETKLTSPNVISQALRSALSHRLPTGANWKLER